MATQEYTKEDYKADFLTCETITQKALERALDTRKFEIDLYWKRAAYFWTFTGAALAGFVSLQASAISNKIDALVLVSCLGIVFSFAWWCVNRASKRWQENWERHVDMLEDKIEGPLYKVVMHGPRPVGLWRKLKSSLTGPGPFSVSKINQVISFAVFAIWLALLKSSLPPIAWQANVNWLYVMLCSITALACVAFMTICRSDERVAGTWATKRVPE